MEATMKLTPEEIEILSFMSTASRAQRLAVYAFTDFKSGEHFTADEYAEAIACLEQHAERTPKDAHLMLEGIGRLAEWGKAEKEA